MKKDVRRDNIDSSLLFYENVRKRRVNTLKISDKNNETGRKTYYNR